MVDRIKIQNAYYDSATEILWADTPDGDVYIWIGIGCARPNVALADAVCDKGSINPDKWVFHRAIYGSPAYRLAASRHLRLIRNATRVLVRAMS